MEHVIGKAEHTGVIGKAKICTPNKMKPAMSSAEYCNGGSTNPDPFLCKKKTQFNNLATERMADKMCPNCPPTWRKCNHQTHEFCTIGRK